MNVEQFYQSRQTQWQELQQLLQRSETSPRQLSPLEVRRLNQLYRQATSDLALAQRDFPSHRVTLFLNQLVARGHATIYRSEPLALRRLLHFATAGFPRTVRSNWRFIVVAAVLLMLPALVAGVTTFAEPGTARWLLAAQQQGLVNDIQRQHLWTDIPINERPYASSFIMQNNIRVAVLAFGGGILLGIPTALLLLSNGLMLGALTGLTTHYGVGFDLWTFVIGHGVIELTVIAIAGGAGLMLGWALLRPGLLGRRDALASAARTALRLIVGCVALLVVAGMIEGFISPAEGIPPAVKWGVGLLSGLLLYSYLLLAGRQESV